jgi:hypothetical protein
MPPRRAPEPDRQAAPATSLATLRLGHAASSYWRAWPGRARREGAPGGAAQAHRARTVHATTSASLSGRQGGRIGLPWRCSICEASSRTSQRPASRQRPAAPTVRAAPREARIDPLRRAPSIRPQADPGPTSASSAARSRPVTSQPTTRSAAAQNGQICVVSALIRIQQTSAQIRYARGYQSAGRRSAVPVWPNR